MGFSCGLGGGERLFDSGHPSVRVRNVRGKSGPQRTYVYVGFSSLIWDHFLSRLGRSISGPFFLPYFRPEARNLFSRKSSGLQA